MQPRPYQHTGKQDSITAETLLSAPVTLGMETPHIFLVGSISDERIVQSTSWTYNMIARVPKNHERWAKTAQLIKKSYTVITCPFVDRQNYLLKIVVRGNFKPDFFSGVAKRKDIWRMVLRK